MPKLEKAERRDRKRKHDRYGMRESGRSVKTLQEIMIKKARRAKEKVKYDDPEEYT